MADRDPGAAVGRKEWRVKVSRQVKIIAGLIIVVPVLLHLLYALWASPLTAYYVTVSELYDNPLLAQGREGDGGAVRMGGEVLTGSMSWDSARGELGFVLTDGIQELQVVYPSPAPDTFRAGMMAIVQGRLAEDGRFLAQRLLLKCPHKYVAG